MKAIRIYIAGPYTSNPEENVRKALSVADELLDRGLVPFIPHLAHWWEQLSPKNYETWVDYGLNWLEVCDCLYRIQGESPGADKETERARELGLPIFVTVEDVANHYGLT